MTRMVETTAASSLLESGTFRIATLKEARIAASLLSEMADDGIRINMALYELMENAIEHGSLGIGGEQKARWVADGCFTQEVERLMSLPENQDRTVRVRFQITDDIVHVAIKDQGQGFDWQSATKSGQDSNLPPTCLGIATAKAARLDSLEYGENGTLVEVTFPASSF